MSKITSSEYLIHSYVQCEFQFLKYNTIHINIKSGNSKVHNL